MASSETRKNRRRKKREASKLVGRLQKASDAQLERERMRIYEEARTVVVMRPMMVVVGGALAEEMKVSEASGRMLVSSMLGMLTRFAGPLTVTAEGEKPLVVTQRVADMMGMEAMRDVAQRFLVEGPGKKKSRGPGKKKSRGPRQPKR
jgi:hypothetical protein